MTTAESALAESIADLVDIASEAGLDPAAARDEGLRVAAALAEAVPGAPRAWADIAHPGLTDAARINEAFFEAASKGRRWRAAPTDLLDSLVASGHARAGDYAEALTEVASAAVMLGTAPIWVIANATAASATYLGAARLSPRLLSPARTAPPLPTEPSGIRPAGDAVNPTRAQQDSAEAPAAQAEPAEPERSVEELLAELDDMIGLERVKKEIHRQVALLTVEKMRQEAGLKATKMSRHLIFVGNPGTGKTTVARLVGAIYKALGLLPKGQLIEVDRSELVAGYVGQTAMKTAEVCAKAVGGVLFIDEAYSLTGDQFAQEAVNTLVKEMEDHREDLVVIVAGYPDPMVAFIAQNPGLASRFTTTIEFDDYTDDELMEILDSIAGGNDYELTAEAKERVRRLLEATPRTPAFGNGRFSRNLFEAAVGRHAWRLKDATEPSRDDLRLLTGGDVVEEPDPQEPVRDVTDGSYVVDEAAFDKEGAAPGDVTADPKTDAEPDAESGAETEDQEEEHER